MDALAQLPVDITGWVGLLLDASGKSAVILSLAALLSLALRRSSAALRHLVWTLAAGATLCLPLLSLMLPPWPMPHAPRLPPAATAPAAVPAAALTPRPGVIAPTPNPDLPSTASAAEPPAASARPIPQASARAAVRRPRRVPAPSAGISWVWAAILVAWALGAVAVFIPLPVGMVLLVRIAKKAPRADGPLWEKLLSEARDLLSVRRSAAVLLGPSQTAPVVWGWLRPVLLLPAEAEGWPTERRCLVLLHELAHVRRGDCLAQMLGHLACALYWFIPLSWLAVRRLRAEQERAGDDLVLATGFRASEYAGHLVEMTRTLRRPVFAGVAAVAMARHSGLEARIGAVLDPKRDRRGVTPAAALVAALAAAAAVLPAARLQAVAAPAKAAVELDRGPGGRPLYQWEPSESYAGKSQADPRLEKPVGFWRAGLALSEVFSSVEEQTGVKLGFWPPGDENERVRVNLYLNPKELPSLRALMAQLMWVTDCAFAYAEARPGDRDRTYYLLSTSIGRAVPRDLHVAEARARDQQQARQRQDVERNMEEVEANLAELRRALELSREEAIARYQGVDDYLLLTLLYPPYRAAAEYVCNMVKPEARLGLGFRLSRRNWGELTEDERALVREAFLQYESEDWPAKTEAMVTVDYFRPGGQPWAAVELSAAAKVAEDAEGNLAFRYLGPPHYLVAPTRDLALSELERSLFEFAQAIGSEMPQDEVEDYRRRWQTSVATQRNELRLKALLPEGALSAEKQRLLSGLAFPAEPGRPYALWEVQQLVAAASGFNIISDCSWQPRRALEGADSALHALALSCRAFEARALDSQDAAWLAAWEWGEAGSFLRFRSTDRDLWRASLLPPDSLNLLDAWLARYLPDLSAAKLPDEGVSLRFLSDLPELFRVAGALDDLQLAYGGRLIYEDPADPMGACRQALREAFLNIDDGSAAATHRGAGALNFFRLAASLSEEQWALVRGQGLNCSELGEDQVRRLRGIMGPDDHDADDPSRLVLKARGPLPTAPPGSGRASLPPMVWRRMAPGHYHRVADAAAGPLPDPYFRVRLAHAEGQVKSVLPESDQEESSVTSWRCDYQVEVHVPPPLRLALPAEPN